MILWFYDQNDPHRLLLNLTDEIDLRRKDKYILSIYNLPNLSIYYTWKKIKQVIQE